MKILLLGDFSACQLTLGRALSLIGHQVTVASEGCRWMHTPGDYDVGRHLPGRPGGALLYARMRWLMPLRGYDVVSLISPSFVQLQPKRLRVLFDRRRRENGAVFLHAAGTDKALMDYYLSDKCTLKYTEYRNPDGSPNQRIRGDLDVNRLWQQGDIADFCEYLYDHIDGVTTALYEYHLPMLARMGAGRVGYTGLPVELPEMSPGENDRCGRPMRFLLGRDRFRKAWKGTDRLEAAARRAVAESGGRAILEVVENIPYNDYLKRLEAADVLIDQLYSYTPAMNALLAMARGKAVMTGGEEEYYSFIGEQELRPIINVEPDDEALLQTFRRCIADPGMVARAASQSRRFVSRHNEAGKVARRFLDFWTTHMGRL